ncbi:MAG TPA: hypothetical protein VHA06_00440 [Candidatus Angelobacter sp.]|nr:hypothetical protein [Candidatus Angelobacter sp.]
MKIMRSVSGIAVRFFKVEPKKKPLPDAKFTAEQPTKKARYRNQTKFRSPLRPKEGWPNQRDGWQPADRTNFRSGKWRVNDVRVVTLADGSTKTFFQMVRRETAQKG